MRIFKKVHSIVVLKYLSKKYLFSIFIDTITSGSSNVTVIDIVNIDNIVNSAIHFI